jgi:dTDP-3-amino-3,4,6-trideoxy-alpha-D-glucose transaminase
VITSRTVAEYRELEEELLAATRRVLASGRYLLGEEGRGFEETFAALCGCGHAVAVASGTDALTIALRALDVGAGYDVLVPALTATATAAAVQLAGAKPVPVDVEEGSLNIDPAAAEAALTPETRAITAVHLYGQPCDMAGLTELAAERGLVVVEDCAQAHGARVGSRPVGSLARIGCFSFYPTKNLGACGDAGVVTTDDGALADRVRRLAQYGWSRRDWAVERGANSRMDELQAALLAVKVRHLERWNGRRREIAARYRRRLAGLPELRLPSERGGVTHVYHQFVIRHPDRDRVREGLLDNDIETGVHYPHPIHTQPAFACDRWPEGSRPVAERAAREVLSLPIHPWMADDEVGRVCSAVREVLTGGTD